MAPSFSVTGETLIPELLRRAPQARPVLDRYGLRGCGGELGPHESLAFFARAHDVPVERLLSELEEILQAGPSGADGDSPAAATDDIASAAAAYTEQPGDTIYRPFFKAAIALVLTVGAAWGALLLMRISQAGSFTAVSIREINAHGHAQIFGWVGLFVMGFAYQAFPRFKHGELSHPRLARATLWMMLGAITVRCLTEPLLERWPGLAPLGVAAGPVEVAAVALFIGIIAASWRRSGKRLEFYDWFIVSALFWFLFQTVYESLYFAATAFAATRDELLKLLALWQAPLRDFQIHGFALLMILGVSLRLFPQFYATRRPSKRLALAALAVLNVSVAAEAAGLILMRASGHRWVALWYAGALGLFVCCTLLVRDWRIFRPCADADRSLKFMRTAYVWLLLSLAMLVLLPFHQFVLLRHFAPESAAAKMGFSHAFYGAIRHAITVGFVSMMIVGVAAKVVPTLRGYDIRSLSPLWGVFALLNTGCATRVVGQTLTDFSSIAFPFTGVSGCFEVAALALWGGHLWHLMHTPPPFAPHPAEAVAATGASPGGPLTGDETVGAVLRSRPELLSVFVAHGFRPLANPVARRVLAHHVTIREACRRMDVDCGAFLQTLNAKTDRNDRRDAAPARGNTNLSPLGGGKEVTSWR